MVLAVVMPTAVQEISAPGPLTATSTVPAAPLLLKLMRPREAASVPAPVIFTAVAIVLLPEIVAIPSVTFNVPKVLSADKLTVEFPSLVRIPEPMFNPFVLTVIVPAPPRVRFGLLAPLMPPEMVSVEASELIRTPLEPSVIAPDQVLLLAVLRRAPPLEMLVPVPVSPSAEAFETLSVELLATVVVPW